MRRAVLLVIAAVLISGASACTVHTDSRDREEARRQAEQAKEEAKRAGEEAKEEGQRAAEEARREAADAVRDAKQQAAEAKRDADESRRDALAEANEARQEALQQGADARRDALEARRDALDRAREDRETGHRHTDARDVVNINTADAQQIAQTTGLTSTVAQKIVASRPYVSKRDLVSKKVVDEQTYWKIEKQVTVMLK